MALERCEGEAGAGAGARVAMNINDFMGREYDICDILGRRKPHFAELTAQNG
jgi:hypothetical protein